MRGPGVYFKTLFIGVREISSVEMVNEDPK